MKKLIAMMLCIVLVLSLVACGKDAEEPTETTTEPTTETTEAPTTEEPTEEATEDFVEDETFEEIDPAEILFVNRDADYIETEIEPTDTMLLLASLYEDYPADQRPGFLRIREISIKEELESNYLPTDMEGLTVVACEPGMAPPAHFTSIITVPEGTDPQTVVDYINTNIDPELRSKWFSAAAETYELVVSGNTILFIMTDVAFAEHCVNAFNAKMAG